MFITKKLELGNTAFIYSNTGRKPSNQVYDYVGIVNNYKQFQGISFMSFRCNCVNYLDYFIVLFYITIYNAILSARVVLPRVHIPACEKKSI